MEKLIIVHYIDVSKADPDKIPELMNGIVTKFKSKDDSLISYFVPINGETRIECINPKMITGEEYKEIQKFLDYQTEFVNYFVNKMKKDEKEHI